MSDAPSYSRPRALRRRPRAVVYCQRTRGESVHGKDFVGVADLDAPRLKVVLARAARLKDDLRQGRTQPLLAGRTVALIFQKPSLRTRVSFEVGMNQLGGRALYLSPQEIRLGEREDVVDAARVLSRMVDAIVARTFAHDDVVKLARYASVPVINGLSDREHPCQTLADLQTIAEAAGHLEGETLAYVGDGNNVAHSLMLAAPLVGLNMRLATPPDFRPDLEIATEAQARARVAGTEMRIQTDPFDAVGGAGFIYTDTWFSMGQEAEAEARRPIFAPYQVNARLLAAAGSNVKVLHCLPAHRGEEITDDVLDGPACIAYDQAENRLHAQKALLVELLTPGTEGQGAG
ncbi:MAG: ornithine carbamoyltransferase [Chloroflexi bacterium]|nr:ornithine carbamoyltransferase [Chloroflexota bacterium]